MNKETYYLRTALAFIRGRAIQQRGISLEKRLTQIKLDSLSANDLAEIIESGLRSELKLYKFKRKRWLPRVRKVLGMLQAIQPASLLDIGSGRGTFLWPLLDEFAGLEVTALDVNSIRANDLKAVHLGGVENLTGEQQDVCTMKFETNQFDVATALEVLEHLPDPQTAIAQLTRVARRFVIASVPSKPDNNPEHIHLFDRASLTQMFEAMGVQRLQFENVMNHLIVIANVTKFQEPVV